MAATPEQRQAARGWLTATADPDLTALLTALQDIYADGALTGTAAATETLKLPVTASLSSLLPDASADLDWDRFWSEWKPGDRDTGELLRGGGFTGLLDDADIRIKGITDSLLDRMGTVLADGLADGKSIDQIAADMHGIVTDPQRAWLIADTEVNRAVSTATLTTYADHEVAEWDLLVSPGACPVCVAAAAANPHPVTDTEIPPLHPRCRCALAPVTPAF